MKTLSNGKQNRMKHGHIVRRLNQLDGEMRQLIRTMHSETGAESNTDGPFILHIHAAAGCLSLRWRRRGGNRSTIEPCESPEAHTLLLQQDASLAHQFFEMEARRIEINHQYSLLFHERKRLRMLVRKRRELKRLKNHFFN